MFIFISKIGSFFFTWLIAISLPLEAKFLFNQHQQKGPLPIIIDTDADLGDLMAITYLVKNPMIDVRAITTVGTGMTHWEYGAKNILNLLDLLGQFSFPVAYGMQKSLSPVTSYPANWRRQADQVSGIKLPLSLAKPHPLTAVELIAEICKKSHEKMTFVSLAPMTNLATALKKYPKIQRNIERVYIMGGLFQGKGNIVERPFGFKNRFAEYNFFLDAKAVEIVLNSNLPITIVPFDIAKSVFSKPLYENLKGNRKTVAANFVYEILKPMVKNKKRIPEHLWAPVVSVLLTNDEIATCTKAKLIINLKKGPEYTRLFITKRGRNVEVVTKIQSEAFYSFFIKILNQVSRFQWDITQTTDLVP